MSRLKIIIILFLVAMGLPVRGQDSDITKEPPPPARIRVEKLFNGFDKVPEDQILRLNLDECLARAAQHNEELKASDYDKEIAEEKLQEAKIIGSPIIEYEYNLAPTPQRVDDAAKSFFTGDITVFNRFKLGIGTPLSTFGKIKLGQELARSGIEAELFKKEQKKSDLLFKVKQLYNGILLARELDRLLDAALERVQKEVEKREQEEEGSDPSELLKLKLFLLELEKKVEESEKKKILAREALKVQMGLDRSVPFDIKDTRLRPVSVDLEKFDTYRDEAMTHRPEVKLLEIGLGAREKLYRLERRKWTPNLGVGAFFEIGRAPYVTGVIATDDFNNPFNFTRAGFGLQLKGQFDFHTQNSKIRQARSEVKKTEIQKELATKGITLELKEAYMDLQSAKADLERSEESGKLSRRLLFLTQSSFDIGLAESKDLVDAVQSFLTTRGQYFEAVFNYNVAVAKLDQKSGRVAGE
ncbi:MAG: TolC family protein [Deltaproteobacteria bacterium]|nr:TolC family protein [Deltaproteobacteria bacterium]